jgi:hypothetical protein
VKNDDWSVQQKYRGYVEVETANKNPNINIAEVRVIGHPKHQPAKTKGDDDNPQPD